VQTEEEPYLRAGPGSPGYTRGPRSPAADFLRCSPPGSPEATLLGSGGPRSATKRRSREEEEVGASSSKKAAGLAKANFAAKVSRPPGHKLRSTGTDNMSDTYRILALEPNSASACKAERRYFLNERTKNELNISYSPGRFYA
jgi:hypothetical protein